MCETTNRNKNEIQKSTQVVKFSTFGQSQWKLKLLWFDITLRAEALKLPISALRVVSFGAATRRNTSWGNRKFNFLNRDLENVTFSKSHLPVFRRQPTNDILLILSHNKVQYKSD